MSNTHTYMQVRSRRAHNYKHNEVTLWNGKKIYRDPVKRKLGLWQTGFFFLVTVTASLGFYVQNPKFQPDLLSPVPAAYASSTFTQVQVIDNSENIDTWIGEAVDEFLPKYRSEARMIMHCLAHREAGHGASNGHGDGGKAGGPFQFWEDTWTGYRKLMIKEGKATEIGSRYDFKEAARTTAWAMSTGRAKAWGPILRDMNGSDFATCQTPSWSK